jgi:hypothetical protein
MTFHIFDVKQSSKYSFLLFTCFDHFWSSSAGSYLGSRRVGVGAGILRGSPGQQSPRGNKMGGTMNTLKENGF